MTIRVLKVQFNSVSSANNPAGWENGGTGNSTGLKFSDGGGFGISLEVISAFAGATASSSRVSGEHYAIPKVVWDRSWTVGPGGAIVHLGGFIPDQPLQIEFFGASTSAGRHRLLTFDGTQFQNDEAGGTEPVTPSAPTAATGNVNSSGVAELTFGSASSTTSHSGIILTWDDAWAPEPTDPEITDDSTDLIIQPGETQTISFIRTVSDPVSLAIIYDDTVTDPIVAAQSDFALIGDVEDGAVSATFTGTIGAMPYTDAGTYEPAHYRYVATCADASTIELAGVTLLPQDGWHFVTAVDPYNDENSFIIDWLDSEGNPDVSEAVDDDQLSAQTTNGNLVLTLNPDFTATISRVDTDIDFPAESTWNAEYWSSVNKQWYSFTKTITNGAEPSEPTILTVGPLRIGGTAAVTVGGFGGTVNAGTLDGVALTSASPTSITIPALIDTEEVPRPGMRDLTLTDGDDSDTVSRQVLPPAGWSSYAIEEGFAESINGVEKTYLPVGWAAGDFILYPSSGNNASINGVTKFNAGTQEWFLIDNATNVATAFDVVTTSSFTGGGGTGTPSMATPTMIVITMEVLV